MTDVYCDQSLGAGGAEDGTNWADAYRTLTAALDGSNVVAGDTLWVKNDATIGSTVSLFGLPTPSHDPPNVIGCISSASTTPPPPAEIVLGLRNGSSTRAYDQTGGNTPPTLTLSGTTSDVNIAGQFGVVYGLVIKSADVFSLSNDQSGGIWEECRFKFGSSSNDFVSIGQSSINDDTEGVFRNCKFDSASSSGRINFFGKIGHWRFDSCEFDVTNTGGTIGTGGSHNIVFDSCDFSATISPLCVIGSNITRNSSFRFLNCKINGSTALSTGSGTEKYRLEFTGVSSVVGKTTGQSFQEVEILTDNGNITQEITAVRETGADDGASGGWSLAFTPTINFTRENDLAIVGPWMAVEVTGDGTSQTVTVFIANSGAADYDDDDVWLEVVYPSESGVAQYDRKTTQMDLHATPAPIPDDTGSTWGTGAENDQKLSVTIAPVYDGFVKCRVHFAKFFGSSPETLYVDPLPVIG